jgi:hypothetical protein
MDAKMAISFKIAPTQVGKVRTDVSKRRTSMREPGEDRQIDNIELNVSDIARSRGL